MNSRTRNVYISLSLFTHMADQPNEEETWVTKARFTLDEQYFITRCINMYGEGQHAFADPSILHYFEKPYVNDCVLECPDADLTQEGQELKLGILIKMETMK